jgi:hypothetical protein
MEIKFIEVRDAGTFETGSSTRPTQLYDRRRDEFTLDEFERISI